MTATRRRKPAAGAALYVVCRHALGDDREYFESDDFGHPAAVPVKAFASRAAADADCAAREAEARQTVEPFPLAVNVGRLPRGGAPAIARAMRKHGLSVTGCTDAGYRKDGLAGWWRSQLPKVTPESRAAAWALFPAVAFYRVTETTLEG